MKVFVVDMISNVIKLIHYSTPILLTRYHHHQKPKVKQIIKVDDNTIGNISYSTMTQKPLLYKIANRKQKEMSSKIKTNLKYDACGILYTYLNISIEKKRIFMINFTVIKIHQHFHFYFMYKFFICTK